MLLRKKRLAFSAMQLTAFALTVALSAVLTGCDSFPSLGLVTVVAEGEGTVDVQRDGDTYTLTADPAEGWSFSAWEGTDETGNPITITVEAATTITAVFIEGSGGDADGDGVPDDVDQCIDTEGTTDIAVDETGCPIGWATELDPFLELPAHYQFKLDGDLSRVFVTLTEESAAQLLEDLMTSNGAGSPVVPEAPPAGEDDLDFGFDLLPDEGAPEAPLKQVPPSEDLDGDGTPDDVDIRIVTNVIPVGEEVVIFQVSNTTADLAGLTSNVTFSAHIRSSHLDRTDPEAVVWEFDIEYLGSMEVIGVALNVSLRSIGSFTGTLSEEEGTQIDWQTVTGTSELAYSSSGFFPFPGDDAETSDLEEMFLDENGEFDPGLLGSWNLAPAPEEPVDSDGDGSFDEFDLCPGTTDPGDARPLRLQRCSA
jgi:hypothetical protein